MGRVAFIFFMSFSIDSIVLIDAGVNDNGSDSSDTTDMPSECVTSKPMVTALGSACTEQLHDIGFIGR